MFGFNSSSRHAKASKRNRISDIFPTIACSDDGIFLLEDSVSSSLNASVGFAFLVSGVGGFGAGLSDKLQNLLLLNYPKDSFLSVLQFTSPDIERFTNEFLVSRMNRKAFELERKRLGGANYASDMSRKTIEKYAEFLKTGTQTPLGKTGIYVRDMRLMFSVKIPVASSGLSDVDYQKISDLRHSFGQILSSSGCYGVSELRRESYLRFMEVILNWNEGARWKQGGIFDNKDMLKQTELRNLIVDKDNSIEIDDTGVCFCTEGKINKKLRILTPARYPEQFSLMYVGRYFGDDFSGDRMLTKPMFICQNFFFSDGDKMFEKMVATRAQLNYQAYGRLAHWLPGVKRQKEEVDALLAPVEAQGNRLLLTSLTIGVFGEDERDARSEAENIKTYFKELGFHLDHDPHIALPLFLESMPFGQVARSVPILNRYSMMASSQAVSFMPVSMDGKGFYRMGYDASKPTSGPVAAFVSRNGQLMGFDMFCSDTNYNMVVAAESGSGKSFLINNIADSYFSIGSNIWIIDAGRSYKKMCDAVSGDFIELTEESKFCLNPFELINDPEEELDLVHGLLVAMACENYTLTDYQSGSLKKALIQGWETLEKKLSVNAIFEILHDMAKDIVDGSMQGSAEEVFKLAEQLYPFTSAGYYGRWFNGTNNINFSNPLTVMELESLKSRPHLQKVVLLQLIYQIQQKMFTLNQGNHDGSVVPNIIIIDEAWALLTEGPVSKFIENAYRRLRKFNGAAITITQGLPDLFNNKVGQAITDNSAYKVLLGQTPDAVGKLEKDNLLNLGESAYKYIGTVKTRKGLFSEICFIHGGSVSIGRLVVPRFQQLLYSTDAVEVNMIDRLMKDGRTMEEAINEVIASEAES